MRLFYVRSSQIVLTEDDWDDTSMIQAAELIARFGTPTRVFVEGGHSHKRPVLHQLVGFCVCNPQPPEAGAEVCVRDVSRFGVGNEQGSHGDVVVEHLERAGYQVRFAESPPGRDIPIT